MNIPLNFIDRTHVIPFVSMFKMALEFVHNPLASLREMENGWLKKWGSPYGLAAIHHYENQGRYQFILKPGLTAFPKVEVSSRLVNEAESLSPKLNRAA